MNTSKKIMLFTIFGALVLAVGVFLMVSMTDKDKDIPYDKISAGDIIVATWNTEDGKEKADTAKLTFQDNGNVSGKVSGYKFIGTCKKVSEGSYTVFNKDGKETYEIEIKGDKMTMTPKASALTLKWTLTAN